MRRRDLIRILAPAALAPACHHSSRQAIKKLIVSAGPYRNLAPLHLAVEDGYFRKAGLEVEFQQLNAASAGIPPLAGGKLDVAFATLNAAVVNAIARGSLIRVVAAREHAYADCGDIGRFLLLKKSFPGGIRGLGQLRGKRVSLSEGTGVTSFAVDVILEQAGLTTKDFVLTRLGTREKMAALMAGKIDAATTSITFELMRPSDAQKFLQLGGLARVYPGYQYSFILFGRRLLEADPSLGARFLAAYLRSVHDYVGGRTPRFLAEFAKTNDIDYEYLRKACRHSLSMEGSIDLASVQAFLDWAVRKGYCDRPLKAAEMVDTKFLELARK